MATPQQSAAPSVKHPTAAAGKQAVTSIQVAGLASPQQSPVIFLGGDNGIAVAFKVDMAKKVAGGVRINGWSAGPCLLRVICDGDEIQSTTVRSTRPDVAAALKVTEPAEGFGFSINVAQRAASYAVRLLAEVDGQAIDRIYPLSVQEEVRATSSFVPIVALGYIEGAMASTIAGAAVLVGWVLHHPDVKVWAETEDGIAFSLDAAHRVYRQDVLDTHGAAFGGAACDAGFILRLEDVFPGQTVRLMAQQHGEPIVLAEVGCNSLPANPVAASRWLFGLSTPLGDMHQRLPKVDMPIIKALTEFQQRAHAELPVVVHQTGNPVRQPLVSVIVPLYGRADFVEHQLVEFCRDNWFVEHAQLIYVLDDPKLLQGFSQQAETLSRLYRVPFQWVWGGANRGFAGANNLGAGCATAPFLLFLNSDVFPQAPGWVQPLLDVLATRDRVGAVGPRLVFASGSIQHAGMECVRRQELGIWINHHPFMGLDAVLDPHREITVVPAVTGACLAMRRRQFDEVGGWDPGYLIGDFEDSDLCFKLRAAGWDIAYHPGVELTHLERQSFKLLGEGDYRTRVVIHNAVRHQMRWASALSVQSPQG